MSKDRKPQTFEFQIVLEKTPEIYAYIAAERYMGKQGPSMDELYAELYIYPMFKHFEDAGRQVGAIQVGGMRDLYTNTMNLVNNRPLVLRGKRFVNPAYADTRPTEVPPMLTLTGVVLEDPGTSKILKRLFSLPVLRWFAGSQQITIPVDSVRT